MAQRKDTLLNDLRENIRTEILKDYSTIEQFCFDKDLNKATLSNFFNNKKDTRISTILRIAEALGKRVKFRLEDM